MAATDVVDICSPRLRAGIRLYVAESGTRVTDMVEHGTICSVVVKLLVNEQEPGVVHSYDATAGDEKTPELN